MEDWKQKRLEETLRVVKSKTFNPVEKRQRINILVINNQYKIPIRSL